jgi:formylglycine-generating enzyme required for sulfatase activity
MKEIIWKKDEARMVLIPANYGKTKDTYNDLGELIPGQTTTMTNTFYMDTTEVTVGQFKKFLKSSGYKPKKPIGWENLYKQHSPTDKHPMCSAGTREFWNDAVAYAKWVGKRLPTEKVSLGG